MIDEKYLLQLLKLWTKQVNERGTHYTQSQWLTRVIEEINTMPKVGEWIPVEEALPKEDGWYLVQYDKPLFGNMLIDVVGYDDRGFLGVCEVVAWQPLPKSYSTNN